MKWGIIIFIGVLVIGLIGALYYKMSNQNVIELFGKEQKEITKQTITYEVIGKGNNQVSKTYGNETNRLRISDNNNNTILDITLLSGHKGYGLLAGSEDNLVAEFLLNDYSTSLQKSFDSFSLTDVKKGGQVSRNITFKYAKDTLVCDDSDCWNETTFIPFTDTSQLPSKVLRISLWTKTIANETVEWIPSIKGFNITEWAEWDVSTAVNTANKSIKGQDDGMQGIYINSSGTGMYLIGSTGDKVYQYYLSTPWDVTTAVNTNNLSTVGQDLIMFGIFINSSGTGMYLSGVGGFNKNIYQYYLSTPWNVTTAVNTNNLTTFGNSGIFINSSGTGMYTSCSDTQVCYFSLSTPWLISSATNILNVSVFTTGGNDIILNSSGTGMYLVDSGTDRLLQYQLLTAWDISTAKSIFNLSIVGQDNNMRGLFINDSGTGMYLVGITNDKVYQYFMAPIVTDTCTYSSGNWAVNCNDNCTISSNVNLGGNNISINGTGTFRVSNANITNYKRLFVKGTDSTNICSVKTTNGGFRSP